MLKVISAADTKAVGRLFDRQSAHNTDLDRRVATIVADVRRRGDTALLSLARQFDGLKSPLEVTRDEIAEGVKATPTPVRKALREAAKNIRAVAKRQIPKTVTVRVSRGVTVEQRVTPLARVGCYVPGGRYPLPSSLLMTAIPARVAGVTDVVAVCPRPEPVVLAAAAEAGVTRLFRIGGAHAIAALAYGTATVPRVDKIVGPGNAYVASAKALVSADCAIDFRAGPTEIVIVTGRGRPEWIAADLIAQAEHDVDARAIVLTWSRRLAMLVQRHVNASAPLSGPARASLAKNGAILLTRHRQEAIELANRLAPEHLVCDDDAMAAAITHAGAVFVGPWTAQATGDYATGSNHVLPTNGAARFRGGLSAADFVRVSAVQRLTQHGLRQIAPIAITLAEAEGLSAHARSIAVRLS